MILHIRYMQYMYLNIEMTTCIGYKSKASLFTVCPALNNLVYAKKKNTGIQKTQMQ